MQRRSFCGLIGTLPLLGLSKPKFVTALEVITDLDEVGFYIDGQERQNFKLNHFTNCDLYPVEDKLRWFYKYEKLIYRHQLRYFVFWKPNLKEYSFVYAELKTKGLEPKLIVEGDMNYKVRNYMI